MSSRRLRVIGVEVKSAADGTKSPYSIVTISFSRKLTQLEVSGVRAVLEGEIK